MVSKFFRYVLRLCDNHKGVKVSLIKVNFMSELNPLVPVKARKVGFTKVMLAALVVSATNAAMAVDNISALGDTASENMSAALVIALGIFAVGVGIVGSFKGYDYLKSGIKKA
jgi:hypothetical protein